MEGVSSGGKGGFEFINLSSVAKAVGTSEPAVRFLIALIIGYPLSLIYHAIFARTSSFVQNLYFTVSGILVLYFGFGQDFIYPIISVLVTFVVLVLIGGTKISVFILFSFNLLYLIIGYAFVSSDGYDIKWTTPQCILCLRLIGLAWDVYDGKRPKEELSSDQKLTALVGIPSFLELMEGQSIAILSLGRSIVFGMLRRRTSENLIICGFSFFYGAQMVGPQFPMKRYKAFIEGNLINDEAERKGSSRFTAGFSRLLLGVGFLIAFVKLDPLYPMHHVMSKHFLEVPLWLKSIELVLWYQILFLKYIFAWLFAEGCCIFTGLSYNGVDENGHAKWDGLRNIRVTKYFTGYTLESLVKCFNINTNEWVLRYVFKRLRFLGNKHISHISALMFLAIWHGFYVGYFITFAREFSIIVLQRQFANHVYRFTGLVFDDLSMPIKVILIPCMYAFKQVSFGYCVISFVLLRWRRTKPVLASMYYIGTVMTIAIFLINMVAAFIYKAKKKSKESSDKKTS